MNKKLRSFLTLCLAAALAVSGGIYAPWASAEPLTEEVAISLPAFSGATGVDLNLRLNPEFVETAEVSSLPEGMNASFESYQNGAKLKIGIVSAAPFSSGNGVLPLRLTLKKSPGEDSELCKLLQVTVDESVLWQASDCILLSGVRDGASYGAGRTVTFNEGSATLNGEPFVSGTTVSAEGEYVLRITDLTGRVRTVSFAVDKTAPVITVDPFDTAPSRGPVTVTASVNEGTLEKSSHTFSQNGSYTFVAVDAAGNRAEKTVTVSHLYRDYTAALLNLPENLTVLEGLSPDVTGWQIRIEYDNGMIGTYTVSPEMVTVDTSTAGQKTGTVTRDGCTAEFSCTVTPKSLVSVRVTTPPSKLTYLEGESFSTAGMVLTAYYNNGTSSPVIGYTLSGYTSTVGTKTVTVSYGGKSDTVTVTVKSRVPAAITSPVYPVKDGTIRKIPEGTTVATLLAGINERDYCKVYQGNSVVSGSTLVGTGMVVKLLDGSTVKDSVTVIVTGDTNGDGKITVTDMISVKAHILKKDSLTGAFASAADTNGDRGISITDFIQIKAKILGKGSIIPQ